MALDPNAKDGKKACYAPAVAKVTVAEADVRLGDPNGDGKINMSDVYLILRYTSGESVPEEQQRKAADVNGDGKINMTDTYLTFRYVLGEIDTFLQ